MAFRQHCAVERATTAARVIKANLVGEDGLAGAGRALDDVDTARQEPAAEHQVEARHAGRRIGEAAGIACVLSSCLRPSCAAAWQVHSERRTFAGHARNVDRAIHGLDQLAHNPQPDTEAGAALTAQRDLLERREDALLVLVFDPRSLISDHQTHPGVVGCQRNLHWCASAILERVGQQIFGDLFQRHAIPRAGNVLLDSSLKRATRARRRGAIGLDQFMHQRGEIYLRRREPQVAGGKSRGFQQGRRAANVAFHCELKTRQPLDQPWLAPSLRARVCSTST